MPPKKRRERSNKSGTNERETGKEPGNLSSSSSSSSQPEQPDPIPHSLEALPSFPSISLMAECKQIEAEFDMASSVHSESDSGSESSLSNCAPASLGDSEEGEAAAIGALLVAADLRMAVNGGSNPVGTDGAEVGIVESIVVHGASHANGASFYSRLSSAESVESATPTQTQRPELGRQRQLSGMSLGHYNQTEDDFEEDEDNDGNDNDNNNDNDNDDHNDDDDDDEDEDEDEDASDADDEANDNDDECAEAGIDENLGPNKLDDFDSVAGLSPKVSDSGRRDSTKENATHAVEIMNGLGMDLKPAVNGVSNLEKSVNGASEEQETMRRRAYKALLAMEADLAKFKNRYFLEQSHKIETEIKSVRDGSHEQIKTETLNIEHRKKDFDKIANNRLKCMQERYQQECDAAAEFATLAYVRKKAEARSQLMEEAVRNCSRLTEEMRRYHMPHRDRGISNKRRKTRRNDYTEWKNIMEDDLVDEEFPTTYAHQKVPLQQQQQHHPFPSSSAFSEVQNPGSSSVQYHHHASAQAVSIQDPTSLPVSKRKKAASVYGFFPSALVNGLSSARVDEDLEFLGIKH
ncbi:hypothetical protein BJ741DRAFT_254839 [Chytriomyces cf. hyalinus JEL632]|nr:hypothetical protein BJ741DRAFT_254839 [Chytriomyces cf. hyalinus JEL632]